MKLNRLTERVWIYPYEEARDRPNLGYIRGDRWSLAVDAGHSDAHAAEFYRAIEQAGLPLPRLTVLTHWHWDHTFGMHAVKGLSLANERTNAHLSAFKEKIDREGVDAFLSLDERIRNEYADDKPVVIALADMVYSRDMALDAGNCPIKLLQSPSPHTDDSTLVYLSGEKLLFLGDAACGEFPTWEADPALCRALAGSIEPLDVDVCLQSHWTPQTKREIIDDLIN